jgi:AcrR family transcriptional regulator
VARIDEEQRQAAARPKRVLLGRTERRAAIVDAARRAFARKGFAGTLLDDIAEEASISKAILYRHFESKGAVYQAVLDDVAERLGKALGADPAGGVGAGGMAGLGRVSLDALIEFADADSEGFRILFEHAAAEPEFRGYTDELRDLSVAVTQERMADKGEPVPAEGVEWAARLIPSVTIAAILTWLDAGKPCRDQAPAIVRRILAAVTTAFDA